VAIHPAHEPRLIGSLTREPAQAFQSGIHRALLAAYPDLRSAHMGIIIHIDHPPGGTRLTELAERMQITKQSLGELVDYLEPRGYVERIPDPADRRSKLVRLTQKGWQVHEDAAIFGGRIQENWTRCFGEKRMATLLQLLADLGRCIEEE
jgi:DNA-binding MarR family transcriptional regulator